MSTDRGLLTFPCEFMIKVVGMKSDSFEIEVLSTIRRYVSELKEDCISTRLSKDGHYLSLSITITATSQKQLDSLYNELTANPRVIIAL